MQVKGSDSHDAELQYSDDFGGTWRLLVHDVLQMMWASETELARSAAFCTQCSAPHRTACTMLWAACCMPTRSVGACACSDEQRAYALITKDGRKQLIRSSDLFSSQQARVAPRWTGLWWAGCRMPHVATFYPVT
jgi:hypothetical protein